MVVLEHDGLGAELVALAGERPRGGPIGLELIDPATLERTSLGSFSREALASKAGADALAVVEPDGAIVTAPWPSAVTVTTIEEASEVSIETSVPFAITLRFAGAMTVQVTVALSDGWSTDGNQCRARFGQLSPNAVHRPALSVAMIRPSRGAPV